MTDVLVCQKCIDGKCRRRDSTAMSAKMMEWCANEKAFAEMFDDRLGVVNESIKPASEHLERGEDPPKGSRNRDTAKKLEAHGPVGNTVRAALGMIDTPVEQVERWLDLPAACSDVDQKLNQIGEWARRVVTGERDNAKQILATMIGRDPDEIIGKRVSTIGDRLKVIIERDTGMRIPCDECKAHIMRLNTMTISEVRGSRDKVIKEIADRAKRKAPSLWQRMAVTIDQALHMSQTEHRVGKWVDEALDDEEKGRQVLKKKDQDGGLGKARKVGAAGAAGVDGPSVERVDFADPVRNLIYHVYPMKRSRGCWEWNLDQLIQRIDLFNGKRIVAIAHDKNAEKSIEVQRILQDYVDDFLILKNSSGRAEGASFVPLMERVESLDKNEVTFRAHAKGVSRDPVTFPTIRGWTEAMYATCLDDWATVESQLKDNAVTGSFRRLQRLGRSHWHYSGSFYWFRNHDVFNREWRVTKNKRYDVEAWPGIMFSLDNAGCLFYDNVKHLYTERYWQKTVLPEYRRWAEISRNLP